MSSPVAVVTGAANGLGLGLAIRLAARGHRIVLADIEDAALERAGAHVRESGIDAITVRTDVTRADDVAALAEQTIETFGRVDVVCLNAGVSMRGRAWELDLADWRWIYDVNVFGVVHGIRSFVPHLLPQPGGRVVITASNTSVASLPSLAPYVSSKHALLSIGETLQHDLDAIGSAVSVSVVLPSAIRSTMADATRNRPSSYGTVAVPEEQLVASRAFLATYGEDPVVMADGILHAALDDRRFVIFTDPDDVTMLQARSEALAAGRLGPVAAPGVKATAPSGTT